MAKKKVEVANVSANETKVKHSQLHKPDSTAYRVNSNKKYNITKEKILELLPKGSKHNISDELLELISKMGDDTGLPQDLLEEDFLGYLHLAAKVPRLKLKELVNAVKFCNLKRNYGVTKAWSLTFPEKYDRLKREGMQVENHASMFNSSKLVQEIDKEMLIPVYLQYQPYMHAAVKKQFDLMNGYAAPKQDGTVQNVSPMVQHLAAKTLYEMTAMPQEAKIDLTISKGKEELDVQRELNMQLAEMVKIQKARLEAGESIDAVQQVGLTVCDDIIEGEVDE